ncbi:MAG: hypothetical protein HKP30_04445 [Myxococcales bacterium]|nr:hypothetical protein [Myxococcales bacterium]
MQSERIRTFALACVLGLLPACSDGEAPSVRPDRPKAVRAKGELPPCAGQRPAQDPQGGVFCAGPPDEVLAWYRSELAARGWTFEGTTRREGRHLLAMAIDDRKPAAPRRTTVSVEAEGDASRVHLYRLEPEALP